MASITLRVNGTSRTVDVDPATPLLYVLRNDLDLQGPRFGCGLGQCGACTVIIKGEAVRSCIRPVSTVAGAEITTLEGLAQNGRLHPLQEAFIEKDAMQCGYCTPGMIVEAAALLRRTPNPGEDEIARAMQGHVCRCCTYPRIVEAIRAAASQTRKPRQGGGAPTRTGP